MTILQQNSGTFNGSSFTVSLPAASAAGNVVVIWIGGNTVVNTPGGMTLRHSQVNQMGHYLFEIAGGATSWNFTNSAGQGSWWVEEIEGGAYLSSSGANTGSTYGTSYASPNNTPTAGDVHVTASMANLSDSTPLATASGWTNSFVEQVDTGVGSADWPAHAVADLAVTANGSTAYSTTATFSKTCRRSAIIASYSTEPVEPPPETDPLPVAYDGAGTAVAATVAATPFPLDIPASAAENDLLVAVIGVKAVNPATPTATDWTLMATSVQFADGVAAGTGVGEQTIFVLGRVVPAGGLSGTVNFTVTGSNSTVGRMLKYSYTNPSGLLNPTWEVATAASTSYLHASSTTWGGTGAANINIDANDHILGALLVADDTARGATPNLGLTVAGATLDTLTDISHTLVTTGGDSALTLMDRAVTAGPSTAAPVATLTGAAAETGGGLFLRVRAVGEVSDTTPVQATRSTTWATFAPVQATRQAIWAALAVTQATRATSWTVRTPTSATRSTSWVTRSLVQQTRPTTWNTAANTSASRATSWVTRAVVQQTRSTSWAALVSVQATRLTSWATRAQVSATRSTTWDVFGLAAVSASRSTTWATLAQTSASRSSSWATRASVTPATRSTSWVTRESVQRSVLTTWVTRQGVTATRATTWTVRTPVSVTRVTTWRTLAGVTVTRSTTWNVNGTLLFVSASRSTTWFVDAFTPVSASRATSWATRAVVPAATRSTSWSVLSSLQRSVLTTWVTREMVSASRVTVWDLATQVAASRTTSWTVRVPVLASRSTSWSVAGPEFGPPVRATLGSRRTAAVGGRRIWTTGLQRQTDVD